MTQSTFGIIGLGTMGRNLALNIESHGFPVAVWNLETEWTDAFLRDHAQQKFAGTRSLQELIGALERPRRLMMMIPAGAPVDQMIGPCSRRSLRRQRPAHASPTSAPMARDTSSRWCTTASSTATCS